MKLTATLRMVLLLLVLLSGGCRATNQEAPAEAGRDGGGSSLDCAPVADSALRALRRSAPDLRDVAVAFAAEVDDSWFIAAPTDAGVGLWRSDDDPTAAGARVRVAPLDASPGDPPGRATAAASDAAGVRAIVRCAGSE